MGEGSRDGRVLGNLAVRRVEGHGDQFQGQGGGVQGSRSLSIYTVW